MAYIYIIRRELIQLPTIDRSCRPSIRNRPATNMDELFDQYWSIADHDSQEISRHTTEVAALAELGRNRCSSWERGSTVYGELFWIEPWEVDEDGDLVDSLEPTHWAEFEEEA